MKSPQEETQEAQKNPRKRKESEEDLKAPQKEAGPSKRKRQKPQPDWWIEDLSLKKSDRPQLVANVSLCDPVANAAQKLIARKYPHIVSLQDTLRGRHAGATYGFGGIDADTQMAAQVIHNGTNHWIATVYHAGSGEVRFYDSLGWMPNDIILQQMEFLYYQISDPTGPDSKRTLRIKVVDVQKQTGTDTTT